MSLVGKGVRGAMWFNFGLFLALRLRLRLRSHMQYGTV